MWAVWWVNCVLNVAGFTWNILHSFCSIMSHWKQHLFWLCFQSSCAAAAAIAMCNKYLQCISKSDFFNKNPVQCFIFRICEVWRLSTRGLSHIWLQVTKKKVRKFRNPTKFWPQSRTCCLYSAISIFCPFMLLQPLWAFLSKKSPYICCCTGFFSRLQAAKHWLSARLSFSDFLYTKIW